jgi:HAE1 family hydrophobic/amphiphilic exporter-1
LFQSSIKFFLENEKFNYSLFFFIVILGLATYSALPKEKFPIFDLDRVMISGGYTKTSNQLLDKIAVNEIEKEIRGVEGIASAITTISNGAFSIVIEVEEGRDISQIADKLRDGVSVASKNFPSDMTLPTVRELQRVSEVIKVALTSSNMENALLNIDSIRDKILSIDGVANLSVQGERDRYLNIQIDPKRVELFGLSIKEVLSAIQGLSHIYPLGKIESKGYHLYLLSEGGKESVEELEKSTLQFGETTILLSDIASVEKSFEEDSQISSVNLDEAIIFAVNKFEDDNALRVAERVKNFVEEWNRGDSDLKLYHFLDDSRSIRDRLNNVISNILFGLVLVFLSIYILVSKKMALVVTIGVPTSFFIAFIFLYLFGYSLNLISLLALLIALGVLVDDAIIVSENIQRHLENGESPAVASRKGTLEVITPVTMASLTTMFTFMPLLFMSGHAGNFIMMIPITVTVLVIASYFESFLFLPLHAKHLLRRGDSVKTWELPKRVYRKVLQFHIDKKWIFLVTFLIGVPFAIFYSAKMTKFQFFPRIDAPILYISGKVNESSSLLETDKIVKRVSEEIWRGREEWGIANISSVTGFRRTPVGERQNGENLFYLYLDLYEQVPKNFVEKYITPYLSLDYDGTNKIRVKSNDQLIKEISAKLEQVKSEFQIDDLSVFKKRIGAKVDVEIGIVADSTADIFRSVEAIEREIKEIDGISSLSNNAYMGVDEVVLQINSYGKLLGVTERDIANLLSSLYLSNQKGTAIDERELLEVVVESIGIDDIDSLSTLNLTLSTGEKVRVTDIVDFQLQRSLESIDKYDFRQMKSIFVNVDTRVITADEVLEKLEPTFQTLRKDGIDFDFLGEKERKDQMKSDLGSATILAFALIFLALVLTFKSFGTTLLIISVIPFSLLGVLLGHFFMDLNLTMPGVIGAFGLAGVVINDSIVMLTFLKMAESREEILDRASQRFRPIVLTSITTLIGLSTIIFFVSGQGLILQPIAVSLGFGLAWGTILNLLYLPVMYSLIKRR